MLTFKPFLWYSTQAEEAAHFYAGIIPNSRVISVTDLPTESPSGPAGSVKIVEFTVAGQPVMAMSAPPMDQFNYAVSFMLECDTQEEIDRLWNALSAGGSPSECGWLKDRYGLNWQITPRELNEMMRSPDRAKAKRAADAMLTMQKLNLAQIRAAFNGSQAA